jgi:hypothetical protein
MSNATCPEARMAKREVTQFSKVEFEAFKAAKREPSGAREKYMKLLSECLAASPTPEVVAAGGWENIQRVRVIEDEKGDGTFVFVPTLPPALYEERKRAAEREERKKAILAKLESLRSDPKAFDKYVREVAKAVLGAAAVALLRASKDAKAAPRKPVQKRPAPPRKPRDAYEAALAQDRRNRREAAKQAAAEYHEAAKAKKQEVA